MISEARSPITDPSLLLSDHSELLQCKYELVAKRYYSQILDRRNADTKGKSFPWEPERPDYLSNLYPIESEYIDSLFSNCKTYMNQQDLAMVDAALAMALYAHQDHYRQDSKPYSTHLLRIAEKLSEEKYQMDAVTIASALLHDAFEDRPKRLNIDDIDAELSIEVGQIVKELSQSRARFQRKETSDEVTRMNIFKRLFDNPRVSIIKIFDRLDNMQTLSFMTDRTKTMQKIIETEDVYIPLAKTMGLYDEAEELEKLCLVNRSSPEEGMTVGTHEFFKTEAEQAIEKYYQESDIHTNVQEFIAYADTRGFPEIVEDTGGDGGLGKKSVISKVVIKSPSAYDIYYKTGEKLAVTSDDLYFDLDIALDINSADDPKYLWAQQAIAIMNGLRYPPLSYSGDLPSVSKFREEYEKGLTDSLSFEMKTGRGAKVRLNIYSKDAYVREQTRLTDLFRVARKKDTNDLLDTTYRRDKAQEKWKYLISEYERVMALSGGIGETAKLLRLLARRTPEGTIKVYGINHLGYQELWPVKKGASIMDYVYDTFPSKWREVASVTVNNKSVSWDYELQEEDRVHIEWNRNSKKRWNPSWITAFRTQVEPARQVKNHYTTVIDNEKRKGIETTRMSVIEAGRMILEEKLPVEKRPLRVSIAKVVRNGISADDFCFRIAMGEASEEDIAKVVGDLIERNDRVLQVIFQFHVDQAGQNSAVSHLFTRAGINTLGIESRSVAEGSRVSVFIDPDDRNRLIGIRNKAKSDPALSSLGYSGLLMKKRKS